MVLNPSTLDSRLVISPFAQRSAMPQITLCALEKQTTANSLKMGLATTKAWSITWLSLDFEHSHQASQSKCRKLNSTIAKDAGHEISVSMEG